ncbi:MAG TPA: hypothetical protein PLV91_04335 [Verrucomicrobiota bacterium]|jgi:hypothetical protein|nr:hypothetical protein [Verrucomicrobiota bacterium]
MKRLTTIISVIAAASLWMAFNTQAQDAAPATQNTPPPCPMGFERPANCPMSGSQATGPNMRGVRGGAKGPMMGGQGQRMSQGDCPLVAPGSNFTPGPQKARRGANAMTAGPRQGMGKGPKAPGNKKAQRQGRGF